MHLHAQLHLYLHHNVCMYIYIYIMYTYIYVVALAVLVHRYGSSLAFSGDGNTLYVGDAHASRGGGNSLPGGVFKYSRVAGSGSGAPPVWSVVYVFYASDAADSAL